MIRLRFEAGTLVVEGLGDAEREATAWCRYDGRIRAHRARACDYAPLATWLRQHNMAFADEAKAFAPLDLQWGQGDRQPRPYQQEALAAWTEAHRRGLVVLPTGSGKSFLAQMTIAATNRPTLVVVPTIDLMQQWATQLEAAFGQTVGMLGGGSKDVRELTVSTYDSAALTMEFIGNRFGLLIVDECHHLPGPTNRTVASLCLAPYRLGLTATPERDDDGEAVLRDLLGPTVYRRDIDELEGRVLSPYQTETISLELDPAESVAYHQARAVYREFVRHHGIRFSDPRGWSQFVLLASRSPEGRAAFQAYLEQKRLARASKAKIRTLWELLRRHAGERALIFTADNDTAYEIGRRFCLPVLTHRTKATERKAFLEAFRAGELPVLVTSRVLNEGIDVPEASVGVVVSGSGSTREHVQRLGRILRPTHGKQARLYELVSMGTSETYTSERRRQHRAYQRPRSRS